MALSLCNVSIVCRSQNKSVVAAAAYRAREKIKNEYNGMTYNYSRLKDAVYTAIVLPENAPLWMYNRYLLWNSVEIAEKRKDAQLARSITIALPRELNQGQNIALVKEYVSFFVKKGMVADISIHDSGDRNPHAHILLTMRPITAKGEWGAKSTSEYVLDKNGKKIKLSNGNYKSRKVNTTDWDNQENVELWREWYANITNKYLKLNGYSQQIDHRSYKRQGLEKKPTERLHRKVYEMEKQGVRTPQGDRNRKIIEYNHQIEFFNQKLAEVYELQEEEQTQQKEEILQHEREKRCTGQEKNYRGTPESSYTEHYRKATEQRLVQDPNRNRQYYTPKQEEQERRRHKVKNSKVEPASNLPNEPSSYADRFKTRTEQKLTEKKKEELVKNEKVESVPSHQTEPQPIHHEQQKREYPTKDNGRSPED